MLIYFSDFCVYSFVHRTSYLSSTRELHTSIREESWQCESDLLVCLVIRRTRLKRLIIASVNRNIGNRPRRWPANTTLKNLFLAAAYTTKPTSRRWAISSLTENSACMRPLGPMSSHISLSSVTLCRKALISSASSADRGSALLW